jgi:membrane protease YdiL (CAAX protease family)
MRDSWMNNKIVLFLLLTLVLIAWPYYTLISAGTMELVGTLTLMWAPGIAAIVTELITTRSIAGLGWRLGKSRYLWTSFLIPLCICIVVYGLLWGVGLIAFAGSQLVADVEEATGAHLSLPLAIGATFVVIFPLSFLAALGEEIGWRGLLLPELAKRYAFTPAVLISAVIWSLYHYPVFLFAGYHSGAPLWFGLPVVTAAIFGFSFIAAWLRLKSGSLWTAALLHGSHNFFIQRIFDRMTLDFGLAPYLTTEFGVAIAIAYALVAFYYWRRRGEVEMQAPVVAVPLSAEAPRTL